MFKILSKERLNDSVVRMVIEAPLIARRAKAGQFIIFRVDEFGERVPLTVADTNTETGGVTIIFQTVGGGTMRLAEKEAGDYIQDFVGPLGQPSELEGYRRACVIGGGVGNAIAFPSAKALFNLGAEVDIIAGFRNKDIVILEKEMKEVCHNLYITTDDGSYGEKGFVTNKLEQLIEAGNQYDLVIAIGPVIMMKVISDLTKKYGIKTLVSLNPIMIDGTGMCGCCRVSVDKKIKFACVDGPEFDGHQVDFDELMLRNTFYRGQEQTAKEKKGHTCRIGIKHDEASKGTKAQELAKEVLASAEAEASSAPAEATDAKPAKKKRNMKLEKTAMPEQEPLVRNKNFEEVSLGYSEEDAIEEALRCLDCRHKPCVAGCPVNVKIPEFISLIADKDFKGAYEKIQETNSLPAVCGRVCPQESQCEQRCVRAIKGEPVGIGRLERFAADWHRNNVEEEIVPPTPNGHKVAILGSGPAGLTCAADLAKLGYSVTIYEAFHVAGGVLVYGIPEFRLPKEIVRKEIEKLEKMGVRIITNMVIGRVMSIDELIAEEQYEAVFIGTGAGLPSFMGIPGESLVGVYSANEYLTRANLMKAYDSNYHTPIRQSKNVAVIGGGNVAMDAARTAKRLGAENVYIVYRRGFDEMPARLEEVHHAKEEEIIFKNLCNPLRIEGDEKGQVVAMECIQMELGEADASGRRRPVPVEGSEFMLEVDTVIVSIGTSPNPLIKDTTEGLEVNKWGCIVAKDNGETSRQAVYAGGDAVTGAATVILAAGAGKTAAEAMHHYIMGEPSNEEVPA